MIIACARCCYTCVEQPRSSLMPSFSPMERLQYALRGLLPWIQQSLLLEFAKQNIWLWLVCFHVLGGAYGLPFMIHKEGVWRNLVSVLLLPVCAKLDVLLGIAYSEALYELRYRVPGSSGSWGCISRTSSGKPTAQVWCVQVSGWDSRFNLEHIEAFRPRLVPQVRQEGTCQATAAIEEEEQTCS